MIRIFQDLRYALRQLRRSPGFTLVAVVTLALGIGVNTAMFSVIHAVLLRPLPFKESGRIVEFDGLSATETGELRSGVSGQSGWVAKSETLEDVAVYTPVELNLTGAGEARRAAAAAVGGRFFSLFGMVAWRGSVAALESPAREYPPVALISYRLWRDQYGFGPDTIGRTVDLNGRSFTIAGIMPPNFNFPKQTEIWIPMPARPEQGILPARGIVVKQIGRLRPRITMAQARTELALFAQQQALELGEKDVPRVKIESLESRLVEPLRPSLLTLMGAVGLVLFIACANVASLLHARNAARVQEMAVRIAHGASRADLFRQFLTESMVLAFAGAVFGLILGSSGTALARYFLPALSSFFFVPDIRLEPVVFLFTLGVAVLTGLFCGVVPALRVSKVNVSDAVKQGAYSEQTSNPVGRRFLAGALRACEVAVALMLLIGAGLLLRSLGKLLNVNPGFNGRGLLTARVDLVGPSYAAPAQRAEFFAKLGEQLHGLPSVGNVAVTNDFPLSRGVSQGFYCGAEGTPTPNARNGAMALYFSVSPGYFRALGLPLLAGRAFDDGDHRGAREVVIVSRILAQRLWPDQDPIGKRMTIQDPPDWMEVVGVAGDVRSWDLAEDPWPQMYVSLEQRPPESAFIVVQSASPSSRPVTADELIRAVRNIDRNEPVSSIRTMDEILAQSTAQPRFRTLLLSAFGGLALLIAIVGISGTVSYSVSRRTREIGVRMALGADQVDVVSTVVRQGMVPALAGVAVGLGGAFACTRLMASLLYGVQAFDPPTVVAACVALVLSAGVASFVPARRAARIDPMVALRYE